MSFNFFVLPFRSEFFQEIWLIAKYLTTKDLLGSWRAVSFGVGLFEGNFHHSFILSLSS